MVVVDHGVTTICTESTVLESKTRSNICIDDVTRKKIGLCNLNLVAVERCSFGQICRILSVR